MRAQGAARARSGIDLRMISVQVSKDVDTVGKALCDILEKEANKAIKERGAFAFSIPGGSVLKMLNGLNGKSSIDWSKCVMAYVNHRCVALDDETSTHEKAQKLFLKSWQDQGLKVITLTGSTDALKEAAAYEAALKALPENVLPRNSKGVPVFDCSLIGVGTDGHIGSLYPNTPAVEEKDKLVVAVVKPSSSSISLSLPVMVASKTAVVASAGKSQKYPLGKAEAMIRCLEANETPASFPASALRDKATWLLDEDAASLLKNKY